MSDQQEYVPPLDAMAEPSTGDAPAGRDMRAPAVVADAGTLAGDVSTLHNINVRVSVVLGTLDLPVRQLLKLGRGAVLELNRKVGEPIDVYVNDRLVARGEMIRLDGKLGVTMTEICKSE